MSSEYLKEVASTSVDAQLSPTQRSHRQLIAALTGVLTAFLNSCMALMAKLATQRRCTTILVMASRGLLSWLFAFMLLVVQRGVPSHKNRDDYVGPRSTWKLMLARVASGSTALFLLLAGVSAMPIGDATVLNFTNLLWTIAFARLFFAEPLRLAHAIGLSLALPGALLVVQPPALFAGHAAHYSPLAPLLPLGSAIGHAGAYTAVQACGRAGVPRSALVHCFSAGSAVLGGAAMLIVGERPSTDTLGILLLTLCGVFGFFAQTALQISIYFDSATTFSIAMLSEVVFAFIWDLLVFGTQPSARTSIGAALLSLGVAAALVGKVDGKVCGILIGRSEGLNEADESVRLVG